MDLIAELEAEQIAALGKSIPDFKAGDTIRVGYKVTEGSRTRVQNYEGVCIARKNGNGIAGSFTVRKISFGEGVERVFPLHSTNIDTITVVRRGRVRRSKLYYLRSRRGKAARISEDTHYKPKQRQQLHAPKPTTRVHEQNSALDVVSNFPNSTNHAKQTQLSLQLDELRLARDIASMDRATAALEEVYRLLPTQSEVSQRPSWYLAQFLDLAAHAVPLMVFGPKETTEKAKNLCYEIGTLIDGEYSPKNEAHPIDTVLRHLDISFVLRFRSLLSEDSFDFDISAYDIRSLLGASGLPNTHVNRDEKIRISVRREDRSALESAVLLGPIEYHSSSDPFEDSYSESVDVEKFEYLSYFVRVDGRTIKRISSKNAHEPNNLNLLL